MTFRITRDNLQALQEVGQGFADLWEEISESIDTWLTLADQGESLTSEDRDAKREAREEFEDRLDEIEPAAQAIVDAYRAGEPAARKKKVTV